MAIAKNAGKSTPAKKEGILKRAFFITWDQFASTTSIHGPKHVSDPRGNKFTRAFWIFVTIFCFLCAAALMATFLKRYKSNPTRINVDTNFGPISEIEYPAVTFCNPNFITYSQMRGLIKSLEIYPNDTKPPEDYLTKIIKFTAAFTNSINHFDPKELPYLQELLESNRFDVQKAMKKLMYSCTKLLFRCRWEGQVVDCKEIFSIAETYQGYCCSFNLLKPVSASAINKAQKTRKTQFFGADMGLSVILNPLIEDNAMTSVNSEGIKILINEYNLYPSERSIERMLPHKQESFVEIRPERTMCSSAVRSLPVSDRGCVFENEYPLRFFPTYMEENCLVACNMQLYIKTCECLPYFFYNTENVETCDFQRIDCIFQNRKLLRNTENNVTDCVCPNQCNGQTYEIRISSAQIVTGMDSVIDPFRFNLTDQHMIVHVYFVSQVYRVLIRSLLTNFISLISNLGGVYSLLIGMSVLSSLEFFYFFSVRFYLNYRSVKTEDLKPKTFSQRLGTVNITVLNVPRLDTAKSRMSTGVSHF